MDETHAGPPRLSSTSRDRGLREWLRAVAYVVAILWWSMLVLSIAADVGEPPRSGSYAFGAVLGTAATTLLVAAGIRWVYARLVAGRRVLSPWLFVLAAVVALVGYAGHMADEEERAGRPAASAHVLPE